ncbi:MAG: cytochrome c biogenesis protein CcsA [Candidatus Thiodiazotropha taylori]|nr:cytochrome c biogenesis protein CcsA [Candidatus Thiodiazotropha endolucinida]MCG8071579.1 cytochrome c biogenesis protein CcsA [Candidatus Thiodiazotropha taylori]MCG8085558.1 cytochrome c biogenesis protein CcsA [Candidatus Thiodiazotropha taylori]MCG8095901.1 cytochrome c biogenesis protein CcsA [Candidatus Thiodiazotropha endolucinida]MCW4227872.1 cytochrome c biogenesis protein CcsA [Candidatus Thiodiazotropha taylori]
MSDYNLWFYLAAISYHLLAVLSIQELIDRCNDYSRWIGGLVVAGTLFVTIAIAWRWLSYGQGPFLTMHEILISSLFSLSLIYGLAYVFVPITRIGAPFASLTMLLLFYWAVNSDPGIRLLPPTYETPWLWVHVIFGKLFLGSCLLATSIGIWLLTPVKRFVRSVRYLWVPQQLERQVWIWLSIAFLFHTVMLIAGAVWAQDAWGRYWDWDPLETWAFITWLCMAITLHMRSVFPPGPRTLSMLAMGVFVLAFLTFFGVPFISINPHQGAV